MRFLTINELKAELGVDKLQLGTTKRGKRKLTDNGDKPTFVLNVQGDLDSTKPMRFMYDEEQGVQSGCLINITEDESGNVVPNPLATVEEEF